MKIRDRIILGMVAGLAGNVIKTASDEFMLSKKLSKRSFRSTAAGVWVSKEKEATNVNGQLLGLLFDFGLGSIGGIGTTYLLSKTGRDHVIPKGVLAGITVGSTITALLSVFPNNKVKPKDAASNLAYMFSHALYGITTTALVAKMGHASLFDPKPLNNYLQPTEYTSEEIRDTAALRQSQERESAMYH